LQKPS